MSLLLVFAVVGHVMLAGAAASPAAAQHHFEALRETRPVDPTHNAPRFGAPAGTVASRVLLAGDSWAQYMWDDGSHNDIFDKFGQGDSRALSLSRSNDPGPGYTGLEYAVGGSQARHWVDTASYPWTQNMVTALQDNPSIDTVVLSIGGNDVLAGKSGGGWYKDMDLDMPGSEAAFFDQLRQNTLTIINAALAVRPNLRVMISSYDYPNFNVGLLCFISACPMRRNLSRDPVNDLITDQEINAMLITIEQLRIGWAGASERILYDHSLGLMHHYYGDGISPAGVLPHPGQAPPLYEPFPGGNPLRPSLRSNFRQPNGLDVDPIHLDYEGYQYKITNQTQAYFLPTWRGDATETFFARGGSEDGWTDGAGSGTDGVRVGRVAAARVYGLVSFDTSSIPDAATITAATLYLHRTSAQGTNNPFESGSLGLARVDVAWGSFGAPDVEIGDAFEPADAPDAGAVFGSAHANGYAVRIVLGAQGLGAINASGMTQFRVSFSGAGSGASADIVVFGDGDATVPVASSLPTLSHVMGTAAPFLDVTFEVLTAVGDHVRELDGLMLRPSSPSPFAASTTLRFSVPDRGATHLAIFDVAGRRIKTLIDGTLTAGPHELPWDGRSASGTRAPAGVYWARLMWDGSLRAQRLVLLKH